MWRENASARSSRFREILTRAFCSDRKIGWCRRRKRFFNKRVPWDTSSTLATGSCRRPRSKTREHSSSAQRNCRRGHRRAYRKHMKVGVLLFNLGGPEKLADVKPFLYRLFSDPEIIRVKWT